MATELALTYGLVSIVISVAVFVLVKQIIKIKFKKLKGSGKLLGLAGLGIALSELVFLGINYGIFGFALEIITSIGVGMVVFGIALQHQLKNIAAGLSLFFNKEVDVGDVLRIKDDKGVIIEIHLTHTVALTDKGERILVPNQKFAEDVVIINHRPKKNYEVF